METGYGNIAKTKQYSFLGLGKIGEGSKKCSVLLAPIFAQAKTKNASNGRKALRKRLLRRLEGFQIHEKQPEKSSTVLLHYSKNVSSGIQSLG